MNGIHVTPEYVLNAAGSCDATAADMDGRLASIRSFVVGLEETYHGVAADQFTVLMGDFDRSAKQLHQTLVAIGQNLRVNAGNYRDTEGANTGIFLQAGGGPAPNA